jgi:hypothetical protein
VRQARFFERFYEIFERVLVFLLPVFAAIGYDRLERPVRAVERRVKGVLFGCRMCGQCSLSETGMSCPMGCPKNIRNGPCGGVRPNGNCEVYPERACVWVEAWSGSQKMADKEAILRIQPPLDHGLQGTSAWLRSSVKAATEKTPTA